MLAECLTENLICLDVEVNTPDEAIRAVGKLLLDGEKIYEGYIDSMVDTYHQLGPYMVIAPGIAIPHGKPGELVKEDCIAFCRLNMPIAFGNKDNDPVKYLFAIGSNQPGGHLNMLKELSIFLMTEGNIDSLGKVTTKSEFTELLKKGGEAY